MRAEAILYVTDLDAMRSFYRSCLGLAVVEDAERHCVLASDAWTLNLVVMARAVAAHVEPGTPPRRRAEVPAKLAFAVPGIEGVRARIAQLGGLLEPAGRTWEFGGSRRLDCVDPEGNVIQLLEAG
jgi:predicted enzyme related to lactoylglutathione lyase